MLRKLLKKELVGLGLLLCQSPLFGGAVDQRVLLTLDDGLRLALSKNRSLLMARADFRTSRERVREARSDALPQLDFSTVYNRNWVLPSFVLDIRSTA